MMLEGKIAVVTGAAQGIGREIALRFAREGAEVAVCDLDAERAAAVGREIEASGRRAHVFAVDVSKTKESQETINKIVDSQNRIDILVNNAGITKDALIIKMDEDAWDSVIRVNLKGAYNFTRAVSRPMMKKRSGKIINIASIVGLVGNPGQANYAASKAGVIGFTKSVARELAPRGICVNAIAPGFIDTKMTRDMPEEAKKRWVDSIPMKRIGEPEDVAKAAVFLASELADYITGQVIVVDGGIVM